MGLSLPMLSFTRLLSPRCFSRLPAALGAALWLALLASAVTPALAQSAGGTSAPSVETYSDTSVPPSAAVLPEGMEWDKPLKAGDMTLQRPSQSQKPKPIQASKVLPSLPVGDLKAPQLSTSGAGASATILSNDKNSSASVMLLQGMQNALQQSGQKPTPPQLSPSGSAAMPDLPPPVVVEGSPAGVPQAASNVAYEAGRAPQALAAPVSLLPAASPAAQPEAIPAVPEQPAPVAEAAPVAEPALAPAVKTFAAPEAAAVEAAAPAATQAPAVTPSKGEEPLVISLDEVPTPKATELNDAPLPLDQTASEPSAASSSVKETPAVSSKTKPKKAAKGGSIFGPAVEESSERDEPSVKAPACEPKVVPWTKTCKEAGYPAKTKGKIAGETRTDCPSGEVHDVWLSNSCESSDVKKLDEKADKKAAKAAEPVAEEEPAALAEPAAAAPVIVQGPVDGRCGATNGLASDVKPSSDLCLEGTSTSVSGDGPWRWSCQGVSGGMSVSCAAPLAPKAASNRETSAPKAALVTEEGRCGSADGTVSDVTPTTNLCAKGIPGKVNGAGPWAWACSGTNGGSAVSCTAPKKTDGVCGEASGAPTDGRPTRDLCTTGFASAVTGDGPWNWTCSGLYGGAAATCSAAPRVNAVCGPASMSGHQKTPSSGLCSAGQASSVEGDGPWTWACAGTDGGASVTCRAPVRGDGLCGPAHGSLFENKPAEGLCAGGQASRVTGAGPWNWTCSGSEGGNTASCTASVATKASLAGLVACGRASETVLFQEPSADLCAKGTASAVTGAGPWSWSCSDSVGHSTSCSSLGASDGACGNASKDSFAQAPRTELCNGGTPDEVSLSDDHARWVWSCKGAMGGAATSCSAPVSSSLDSSAKTAAASAKPV